MPKIETPQTRYDAKNTRPVCFKLNLKYDADILAALDAQPPETGGKQGYIKRLIREDLARKKEQAG